jgi:membrane protease YdiL (CAAX protease family)
MAEPRQPSGQGAPNSDLRQKDLIELVLIVFGFCLLPRLVGLAQSWQGPSAFPATPSVAAAALQQGWNLALLWLLMLRGMPALMAERTIWRPSTAAVAGGLALAAILVAGGALLGLVLPYPAGAVPFARPATFPDLAWPLLAVVAASAFEELLYRSYLLERLRDLGVGALPALAAAILLFAMGHQYQGAHGLVLSAALGSLLGLAWLRWRRFWLVWLAHLAYNLTVLAAAWLT